MPLPSTLGKYQIEREVGRGGFAVVYQAHDPSLGRRVALKVPHAWLLTDPKFVERFRREARLAANLTHPHIVTIHEIGEEQGVPFIAMEWLEGMPLDQWLETVKPSPQAVLQALLGVGAALDMAHAKGVVHRDIKPSNIMMVAGRGGVLTDFGIAKLLAQATASTSGVLGTPNYMAPEVLKGQPATSATDIYAFGVMLYQILTGRLPFEGDTPHAIAYQHANEPPPDPRSFNLGLSPATAALLLQALAKDPRQRPTSIVNLIHSLLAERATTSIPRPDPRSTYVPRSPRRVLVRAIVAVVLVLIVGIQLAWWAIDWVALRSPTPAPSAPATITTAMPDPLSTVTHMVPADTPIPIPPTSSKLPMPVETEMVFVPAGEFLMGCDPAHNAGHSCAPETLPLHTVYLDAFYIDQIEVTNAQYRRYVDAGGGAAPHDTSSFTRPSYYGNPEFVAYPVIHVDWSQASGYCAWAGKRLPTEAEWEKAARGEVVRTYPWGDDPATCSHANWATFGNCLGDTDTVGNYPSGASPYKVMDMAGNVWEWVADWYSETYYSSTAPSSSNPPGPRNGTWRVIRGAGWGSGDSWPGYQPRTANRVYAEADGHNFQTGFRCARSATAILSTPVPPTLTPSLTPTPSSTPAATSTVSVLPGYGRGHIVFSSLRDGNPELYLIDATGSDLRRLTQSPGDDWSPAWSRDARQIAFTSSRDATAAGMHNIYIMDADGSNVRRLTYNLAWDEYADWLPDGSRIAFVTTADNNAEIFVAPTYGGDAQRLTFTSWNERNPAWSPDGSLLAFSSDQTGVWQIYLMNADGSSPRQLSAMTADSFKPAWSPDGRRLAFHSDQNGNRDIYTINTDGSNLRRLTSEPSKDEHPAWSPDGSAIVFSSNRGGYTDDLYVMWADGSQPTLLFASTADDGSLAWGR